MNHFYLYTAGKFSYNKNERCVIYNGGDEMPKVSQKYLEDKKESILQAAFTVCKTKPLYEVTMKDVIRECNISQGGIYRYFSDVDEILVEVINRCNPNADYLQTIDSIIINSSSRKEAVEGLFTFLGNYMRNSAAIIGKFLFELTVLKANQPHRGRKIQLKLKDGQSGQYFIRKIFEVIQEGISSGEFHPVIPEDDILSYISIAIDGITIDGALFQCYGVPQIGPVPFNGIHLINTIKTSVLLMLSV